MPPLVEPQEDNGNGNALAFESCSMVVGAAVVAVREKGWKRLLREDDVESVRIAVGVSVVEEEVRSPPLLLVLLVLDTMVELETAADAEVDVDAVRGDVWMVIILNSRNCLLSKMGKWNDSYELKNAE